LRLVEGDHPYAEGVANGVRYQLFASSCGFEYDAAAALVAAASGSGPTFVAWPRDAPDSVASFGSEVPTGDLVFDARFVVLTATRNATLPMLTDTLRSHLLSLGAPALVGQNGMVWLLLTEMPQAEAFGVAVGLVTGVAQSITKSVESPYRSS
jgi:hypothetical protein